MRSRLYDLVKSTKPASLLVVGDIILDRYISGSVDRISPEAPVQVLEVTDEREVLGGAANVAANAAAMGAKVRLVGLVGKDENAASVRRLLKKWGIGSGGLVADRSRPTTRKSRVVALRQQMLRVDREKKHAISKEIGASLLQKVEKALPHCDGVILSDYGKGVAESWLLKKLFAACRRAGKRVIVDPKGNDYSKYRGAHLITPNKKEAAIASGVDIKAEKDYIKTARKLLDITGAGKLVITRGGEGMSVFSKQGEAMTLTAEALEVFDVSGAGDTVVAALGVYTFSGLSGEDSARVANVAAGIEVGRLGAWPVSQEEIIGTLENGDGTSKLMNSQQAAALSKKMKARDKIVVFTNGCFDLLHAGHVKLLRKAKAMGDCLIVGLNSDSSIRRLKGDSRPLLTETDRLEIVSALDCVDAIALFDEDTPLKLIKAVKPDVLVKGSDYDVQSVVGRDVVEKYGGRVELVDLVKGKSTTGLIEKILNKQNGGK